MSEKEQAASPKTVTGSLSSPDRQLVSIFKSAKKDEMYLYVMKRDRFQRVPDPLLAQFGEPEHVMDLLLTSEKTLARVDVKKVMDELTHKGFYLQMPPPKESMLPTINQ